MRRYLLVLVFLLLIPSVMAETGNIQGIFDRLLTKSSNINGVCEDGENILIDKDCNLTVRDLAAGNIFGYMWFFRLTILAGIVMYFRKSKFFPLSAVLMVGLFAYHGAFGTPNQPGNADSICSIFNLGKCFFPENAFFGWIVVITAVMMITLFIIGKENSKVYKQS